MPKILVAAIDFGTTYSGWAFSFKHDFESEPTKVTAKVWTGGQLVSSKGPTCALIKPDGTTLHSFGYDAETKYASLADTEEHKPWYFFSRFKMLLFDHEDGIHRDTKIKDSTDKELSALTVFSLSIKFLKEDMIETSSQRLLSGGLKKEDIDWVLTVPAIWDDAAKQFMREAAVKAGIDNDRLTIALEPEAASLFCRHLPIEKNTKGNSQSLAAFKAGTKYLVLDAGGGTVDITVHEVMANNKLKELHKASGGAWGGTKVDDAFRQFLIKLVGGPVMKKFQNKHMDDYLDIFRDFEIKKRDIGPSKADRVTFRLPSALSSTFKDHTGETLLDIIPQTSFSDQLSLTGDKLRVDIDLVKRFFKDPVDNITDHVENLLKEPTVTGCAAILMVGGFSDSPLLQQAIRSKFPRVKVIIPNEAGLAVLKGAVIYGHSPRMISERISKYTYGVNCCQDYREGHHPSQRKVKQKDGSFNVDHIFDIYVKSGQKIKVDDEVKNNYCVHEPDQDGMNILFYYTIDDSPSFTDDPGCKRLGQMHVDCPGHGKDRSAEVTMKFGLTEIEACTKVLHTGKITSTKLNFLG
ncbi:Heat shock 70 kDa protein 12A [Mactra antiquata]